MDNKRIVITGVGVVAPNGIGKQAFWQALKEGKSGIKAISRFDTNQFKSKLAGEIDDFKPEEFLGEKGLREMDRTSRLICSAAKMALTDAKFEPNADNTDKIGVCVGSTLSSLWDIAEFNRQIIQDGPLFTDVGLFPGTVINAASSRVSIKFNIQGFNTTISNGFTSSLDAIKYATDMIEAGRVHSVLVGAVESLSLAQFSAFYALNYIAGLKGEEVSCPFDLRRNGAILSEGAAAILIEDESFARKRKAPIFARISGQGAYFDAHRMNKYDPTATGMKQSMERALKDADVANKSIDYISSSANSVEQHDRLETIAIKEVFEKNATKKPVSAIKSMVGETFSAGGLMQIAASIASIEEDFIPPTINYHKTDKQCDLDYVANQARTTRVNHILVNNFGPGGNNASLVLSRHN